MTNIDRFGQPPKRRAVTEAAIAAATARAAAALPAGAVLGPSTVTSSGTARGSKRPRPKQGVVAGSKPKKRREAGSGTVGAEAGAKDGGTGFVQGER